MLRARAVVLLGLMGACSVYRDSLVETGRGQSDGGAPAAAGTSGDAGSDNANAGGASAEPVAGRGDAGGGSGGGSGTVDEGGAAGLGSTLGGAGGEPPEPATLDLIDDMEDGDAFVVSTDGRNGHWDISNDGTPDATQQPAAASFVMVELLPNERPGSLLAAYTRGAGFKDWGAFMTVSMRTWPNYEETPVYDAARYAGVAFYAKAGSGSDLTLRVRYIGAQTDARGGQCTPGGSVETACYDHFYADVKLSHTWQRYELSFADFRQAGVGKSFPSIDLSSMYALELFFPGRKTVSGNAFELWLDDLAFVER